jgi:hypothetical protein
MLKRIVLTLARFHKDLEAIEQRLYVNQKRMQPLCGH